MKPLSVLISFLAALVIFCSSTGSAHAVMKAVGPTDPANGFPVWYQDSADLALQLCLDTNGFCSLPAGGGFNAGLPVVFPGNFPVTSPYWQAQATLATTGAPNSQATLRLALEAAFLGGAVQDGQQVTSLLITLGEMNNLPPNVACTVTHPFGSFNFPTDGAGNSPNTSQLAFRASDPEAPLPGVFNAFVQPGGSSANTNIGPFLRTTTGFVTGPNGSAYLANPITPVQVTGSPTGTNLFRIDCPGIGGPNVNSVQTNLFNLTGKPMPLQVASPAAGTDFGVLKLNTAAPARNFAVTNLTSQPVTPTIGSSNPVFAVSPGSCGGSVAAGASCTFGVTFTPNANGPHNGTISVSGPGLPAMTTIVSGTGDSIAPSVAITTISRFSAALSQTLSGTVADSSGIASVLLFVNNSFIAPATITGGTWSVDVAGLSANAVNPVSVVATDSAGNQATASDVITHDTIAPNLGPISAISPTTSTSQTVSGAVADDNGVSFVQVIVNNTLQGTANLTGNSWSFNVTGLQPGANSIFVTAQDPAGNQSAPATASIFFGSILPDGDVSQLSGVGVVDVADALLVLRAAVGLAALTPTQILHADVAPLINNVPNPDQQITIADALAILRKAVKLVNF